MNKGNLIRAGILFSLFVIILGAAWGCSAIKDKNLTPEIANKDDIYLSVGDVDVTNQELWDQMRLSDGLTYLQKYIEEEFLFTAEIAAVTQEEIDNKIEYYKYGTNDEDALAEIMADQEIVDALLEQFGESLKILGYDPLNADDLKEFVVLEIAKENAVRTYIDTADSENDLAINGDDLEVYYNASVFGDVTAINIVFSSENEANAVFAKFNLVPKFELGWGLYTGSDYATEADTGAFDETNTQLLTDEDVLEQFILMYNYMNPNEEAIIPGATEVNFSTLTGNSFVYNYNTMTEGRATEDVYLDLAGYMFFKLNLDDDHARYSFMLQEFGDFQVITYKVGQADIVAFDDLDASALVDLREDLLDVKVNESNYALAIKAIWDKEAYEILDPIFKLQNVYNKQKDFSNHGDATIVATFNGTDITADMLYNYMKDSVGVYYSIEIVKTKLLLSSDAYTDIYGDSYDYLDEKNEVFEAHQEELRKMKTTFSSNGYGNYGFSSSAYSWNEFLLLAVSVETEADAIRDLYIMPAISPYFTKDSIDYAKALDIVQAKADEHFSLDIDHLLIYVDADKDFTLDKYEAYLANLEGADLVEYNDLTASLKTLILSKIADDITFANMVIEFNDGLIDDSENDWAIYKAYGFHIMTQELSSEASLDPSTSTNYDPDFVIAIKNLYDEYVVIDGVSANEVVELYNDELITTNFGLHFLYATQGKQFDIPTAVYTEADDVDGDYSEAVNNDNLIPTLAQVEMYIEIEFAAKIGDATDVTLPTSVYSAVSYYFGDTFSSYFTSTNYSIKTLNFMLDNNVVFEADSADSITYLEEILELLYDNNFPEGFILSE